jgi:GMP synthase (glutamine-hydrolysing)
MAKARHALRVTLLQIRSHREAEEQEYLCFLERCRLRAEQLTAINLVDRPGVRWADVESADALIIGGAGGHSATEEHAFTAPLGELVARWIGDDRPLFGSCWGHQFMAAELGGSVVTDTAQEEIGSFPIELTAQGRRDPLFATFPERFTVQLGHHDRIEELPPGFVVLARSERCAHQAIRLDGKPVYGSQFHSEMTTEHMRARLLMYRDEYLPPGADQDEIERLLEPSPEVEGLLDRFLTLYS